jgi:fructose-bisphosphate aldolase class I
MTAHELELTARALVAEGKGILAADESTGTVTKRLEAIDTDSTEEIRRTYRRMLVTAGAGGDIISGMIMYDETIRQEDDDGTPFPQLLDQHGIIPGIKVDTGAKPLALSPDEKVTEGLDGLRDRLEEYVGLGARFAKWRAVINIDAENGLPTEYCRHVNAHALARYAALCQEAGLAPIVEPEVEIRGDHTIEKCREVTTATLRTVFDELAAQRVDLRGMLLKPNMVISGKESPEQASVEEVAEQTISTMREVVPAAVPGIVFLSGGQGPERATAHLNAMINLGPHPWEVSFSYARALQDPALETWRGQDENIEPAQRAFYRRAQLIHAARLGEYSEDMEQEVAA